jgi:hypothetical protein
MLLDNGEHTNYEEAMASPDSDKWLEAMKSEIGSMYENKVWTLVDLPDDRRAIENKWIFKKKTDTDGKVTVYKARLVAKGFRQVQGVDYDETFSPVAMLKSVSIILAFGCWKVCKFHRSIYVLEQASRSWNICFDKVIKAFEFIQVYRETCIYKKVGGSSIAFLIVYVDGILLIGNDVEFLESIKN